VPETIRTGAESETAAAGRRLAGRLVRGDLVLVYGELGAGKTAFVRGLAEGLGADPEDVSSPTFTIVQEYNARLRFYHVDLYRLTPQEVPDLGLEDLAEEGVMAIEWAERLPAPPRGAQEVWIRDLGGDNREITIADCGSRIAD
jgi:tRNA threonylcarbamoyladenosine biosynthesis protein TsaE